MDRYKVDKNFVMKSRDFEEDLEEGRLTIDEYGILQYVLSRAIPVTGEYIGNVTTISEGIGLTSKKGKRHVEYALGSLKKNLYLWFEVKQGTRRNYKIIINHYPLSKDPKNPKEKQRYRNLSKTGGAFSEVEDEIRKSESFVNEQNESDRVSEVPYTDNKTNNETENKTNNKDLSFFKIPLPKWFYKKYPYET
ncbi:hypothetical protein KKB18_11585, partial [bacterium]|nr:hypothetical protein [bacterium]